MNTKMIKITSLAAGLAVAAGLAMATGVAAQTPGPGNPVTQGTPGAGQRGGMMGQRGQMQPGEGYGVGGWGGQGTSLVTVAADKLDIKAADLIAELNTGKTIATVAAAKNVAPAVIVDAFLAPRKTQLDAQVKAGRLTQAQADAMLAQMQTSITANLSEPWTAKGPGSGTPGSGFVDADGDGACDLMEAGGALGQAGAGGPMRGNQPMQRGRMNRP